MVEASSPPRVDAISNSTLETSTVSSEGAFSQPGMDAISNSKLETSPMPSKEACSSSKVEASSQPRVDAISNSKLEVSSMSSEKACSISKEEASLQPRVDAISNSKVEASSMSSKKSRYISKLDIYLKPQMKSLSNSKLETYPMSSKEACSSSKVETSSQPRVDALSNSQLEASSMSSNIAWSGSKFNATFQPCLGALSSSNTETSSRLSVKAFSSSNVEAVRTSSSTEICASNFEIFPLLEPDMYCLQCHGLQEAALQILPCGHVYCSQCLDQLGEISRQTHKLSCPKCQASFSTVHPPHHDLPVKPRIVHQFSKDSYASDAFLFNSLKNDLIGSSTSVVGMDMIPPYLYVVYEKQEHLFRFDTLEDTTSKGFGNSAKMMTQFQTQKMNPKGLAANKRLNCIYIVDDRKFVWRLSCVTGAMTTIKIGAKLHGISVTQTNNSVLIVGVDWKDGNGIFVFHDDVNGDLTLERKIELNKSFGDPVRAVEVLSPNGLGCPQYLVSHVSHRGILGVKSDHRISRITNNTEVMACYGVGVGNGLQQLRNPDCIYVDANGMILVVDTGNNRIHLLTPQLQLVRHLLDKDGISKPSHIFMDEEKGLLYVAQAKNDIEVFRIVDFDD